VKCNIWSVLIIMAIVTTRDCNLLYKLYDVLVTNWFELNYLILQWLGLSIHWKGRFNYHVSCESNKHICTKRQFMRIYLKQLLSIFDLYMCKWRHAVTSRSETAKIIKNWYYPPLHCLNVNVPFCLYICSCVMCILMNHGFCVSYVPVKR